MPIFLTLLGAVQGCATYGSMMASDRDQRGMVASRQPGPMLPSQDEYPMPEGQCVGRLEADASGRVTRAIVRCEVPDRAFERQAASQLEALRPVLQDRETGEPARVAWVDYYNTPPEPGKVTF